MTLHLNDLAPAPGARTERTRVGRGMGSFARKGGGKIKAGFEGGQTPMQRRLPKIGFRSPIAKLTAEVLSYQLDKLEAGEVTFAVLRAAGLVPSTAKKAKIVVKGELTKAFVLKGIAATAGAKAAIEAAGGSIQE